MPAPPLLTETIRPARKVRGRIVVPGDKSISHRYALLAALADGPSTIERFAPGADCASTLACLRALGVDVRRTAHDVVVIQGRGLRGLLAPSAPLDAANSGSTIRMLAGVVAAHPFFSTLTGDASLRRRPMQRIILPLTAMGARVESADGRPPITVHGARLHGIEHAPEVPSAQVKSALLLAGLQADGITCVREPAPTRDHTERALVTFGGRVERQGEAVSIEGGQRLSACSLRVPGDVSSLTFWAVAAATLTGSDVEVEGVGLNPTRTAVLDVLREAGAHVEATVETAASGEPAGAVRVRPGRARPFTVAPQAVPGVIDELPALAVLGLLGAGMSVSGAAELRAKESDRIAALVAGLRALGAQADEWADGFAVAPTRRLRGGAADACGDHRLAMAFAVAALGAEQPSTIIGAGCVDVSYPGFFDTLRAISG